jgi:hypothetical protein
VFGEIERFASLVIENATTERRRPSSRTALRTYASHAAMSPALPSGGW